MIIVTGSARSGTSMMMYCLSKTGLNQSWDDWADRRPKENWDNPYGFFEGKFNGEDGYIKDFCGEQYNKYDHLNPRFIWMERSEEQIVQSFKDVRRREGKTPRNGDKLKKIIKSVRGKRLEKTKEYPHIIVNYNEFATNPETYRNDFNNLFPEIDYDKLITGIDKDIYTDRREVKDGTK